eukprot:TRINITY_DN4300_c0_g1_i2.p1 TRINITY_DN4300_c0_g1~~TRINITY_DN4300_c0_g1_i2.p1  ORF type:complete len:185 (+),score=27.92 TRINITY_DN4300_c0_g1_i2:90-644(+)
MEYITTVSTVIKDTSSSLHSFVDTNKRKFLSVAIASGASYYLISKFRGPKKKDIIQNSANARLMNYFENANMTCDTTVLQCLNGLQDSLSRNVERIPTTAQIRSCKSTPEKVEMFRTLSYKTLTKTITGVYTIVLLISHLRIQTNLVGRYLYLDQVLHGGGGAHQLFDIPTQIKYLQKIKKSNH